MRSHDSEDRRLTIRTQDLDYTHDRIAQFLGIPPESLDGKRARLNQGEWHGDLASFVESHYVEDRIAAVCAENVKLYQLAGPPGR